LATQRFPFASTASAEGLFNPEPAKLSDAKKTRHSRVQTMLFVDFIYFSMRMQSDVQ
jgi:hypothetical protein